MEKNINIYGKDKLNDIYFIRYNLSKFSAGEIHVKLNINDFNPEIELFEINAFIKSSDDIITLMMITDAIRQKKLNAVIDLILDYCPYSRQDRVCDEGESLSIKVFANLINSMNYNTVQLIDAHSDVAPALINNCTNIKVHEILRDAFDEDLFCETDYLVSPDAGANKKVQECAKLFNKEFIRADKIRDVKTGHITDTVVYADDLTGKTVFIIDDICDGGRTFIELAKKLIEKGAIVNLYVTFGIFSKGKQCLYDAGINEVIVFKEF